MSKYGISREPGESDLEWRRRYHRTVMRVKAAEKPKVEKVRTGPKPYVPKERKPRKGWPGTYEQWVEAQRQPGESEKDWKNRNARIRHALNKERTGEKRAAQAKAWREANAESERERKRAYAKANPERVKQRNREYFERNREKKIAALKRWGAENPEKRKETQKRWYEANAARRNYYSSKRRADEIKATPAWADLDAIRAIYAEAARITAETGVPHHVDHFYPLRGKTVCGLHVETNLRIILGEENVRKQAKMPSEDDPFAKLDFGR